MTKFHKTFLSLALTGILLFSGCAANAPAVPETAAETQPQGQSAQQNQGAQAVNVSQPAQGAKTVIEYWHVNAETQGGLAVEELVNTFNAQSNTVEVVARYNPDMYKGLMQNLQAEVATGRSPASCPATSCSLLTRSATFPWTFKALISSSNSLQDGMRRFRKRSIGRRLYTKR